MALTWDDLTASFEQLNRNKLLEDWQWLTGSALPVLVSPGGETWLLNNLSTPDYFNI